MRDNNNNNSNQAGELKHILKLNMGFKAARALSEEMSMQAKQTFGNFTAKG